MVNSPIISFYVVVFLVFGVIPFSLLLIQWLKQRSKLKKAGISPETPGCSNCFYIIRGWDSSVCPECGTDVNGKDAHIGITLRKPLKALAAFGAAILIVAFILLPLSGSSNGSFLFIIVEFLTVILLPAYVIRRHKPGTRPVEDGEWLTAADPK